MKEIVKLTIMGDICPTEDYRALFEKSEKNVFGEVISFNENSDLAIANLECAVIESGRPITKCGPCLKAKKNDVSLIKRAGFSILSLANNHVKDYGVEGVEKTINILDEKGIEWFGVGRNSNELKKVIFKTIKGIKIGFTSFAEEEFNLASDNEAGANKFDPYESLYEIRKWKSECDYLIVLYHGGIEHYRYPSPLLQKKCRKMAEAGADIILCQHSHCIGTFETWNGCDILYGQGNGVFGYRAEDESWNEGLLVTVQLSSDKKKIEFRLLEATPQGIRFANKEKESIRIEQMRKESERLDDTSWLLQSWKQFCAKNAALNRALLYGKNRMFNKLNRMSGNKLFELTTRKSSEMVTMNLIRCDAWREVVTTILEGDVYGK